VRPEESSRAFHFRRPLLMSFAGLRLRYLLAVVLMGALRIPLTGSGVLAADYQGTLKIGGTGAAHGTITQVAAAFQKKYPDVRFGFPPSLGSTGGIKAVLAGTLDVGLSSRPLTEAERRHGLVQVEYARTPLLLVTSHQAAGVNFTLKQLASLYAGDLTSFPDGTPIRLIMRPESEIDIHMIRGLSPEMDKAVNKAQSREGMVVAVNDQDNGDILERIRGAIGWMSLGQLMSEGRQVTPLPLDNIMPSQANFASGTYPLFKSFFAVIGAQPTPLAKSFLEFLTSAEGREILLKNGHFIDVKQP
jgi:phosphate transport system substrate-binding protein